MKKKLECLCKPWDQDICPVCRKKRTANIEVMFDDGDSLVLPHASYSTFAGDHLFSFLLFNHDGKRKIDSAKVTVLHDGEEYTKTTLVDPGVVRIGAFFFGIQFREEAREIEFILSPKK